MEYSKEGPNVQSQSEHSAYKQMKKAERSRFAMEKQKIEARTKWKHEKSKTRIRENGGYFE